MQLQFSNEADVPQDAKDSFVPFEQDGATVFMHKDLAETKKESFRNLGQLNTLKNEFGSFRSSIEEKQAEAVAQAEAAKEAALQEQMAKLKDSGEHSELHKLQMQQMQDKLSTVESSGLEWQQKYDQLNQQIIEKDNSALAMSIATQYTSSDMAAGLSKLLVLDGHIKNVGGKAVFTNASGEAVDGNVERYIEVLNQNPMYAGYAKFASSKGGYGSKGGNDSGASKVISRAEFEAMPPHKQSQIIKDTKVID